MKPIELTDNLERTMTERPATVQVFVARRMACPGCPMAPFETVAEAADIYGIPREEFLGELRRVDGAQRS